jgi:hypothetical protein
LGTKVYNNLHKTLRIQLKTLRALRQN